MKPSFALNLSEDGIALLHRGGGRWTSVGRAAFGDDMAETLSYLRATAVSLAPGALASKLVLPNSQILYLTLDAPGPDVRSRRAQIEAALEGRTPYAVADLVYDWSGTGETVQVAVVARETLQEAEDFAVEHRFNPVSFAASPDPGDFAGEPFFGQTKGAALFLEEGDQVERETDPVPAGPLPEAETASLAPADTGDVPGEVGDDDDGDAPAISAIDDTAEAAQSADVLDAEIRAELAAEAVADETASEPEAGDDAQDEALADEPEPETVDSADTALAADDDGATESDAEPARAAETEGDTADLPEAAETVEPTAEEAPFVALEDTEEANDDAVPAFTTGMVSNPGILPGEEVSRPEPAFSTRRSPEAGDSEEGTLVGATPPRFGVGGASGKPALTAPARDSGGGRSLLGGARKTRTPKSTAKPRYTALNGGAPAAPTGETGEAADYGQPQPPKPATEAEAMTRFGARRQQRGKPRFLGLFLTLVLILLLVIAAIWSSFVVSDASKPGGETAVAALPDAPAVEPPQPVVNDEPAQADAGDDAAATPSDTQEATADGTGAQPASDSLQAAGDSTTTGADGATDDPLASAIADAVAEAQDTATSPDTAAPGSELAGASASALPEVAADAAADDAGASVGVAALTGAAEAPDVVATPGLDTAPSHDAQSDIRLAALDSSVLASDAMRLDMPTLGNTDQPMASPLPPLPFGTTFNFGENGLVVPTPEGSVTPDGIVVYRGKPAQVPPARPATAALPAPDASAEAGEETSVDASAEAAPEPAATDAPALPVDETLAGVRPRARPGDRAAPANAQEPQAETPSAGAETQDDAALTAESQTVFTGLRPKSRPEERDIALAAPAEAAPGTSAAVVDNSFGASLIPRSRPKDLARAVAAAVAAAQEAPASAPEAEVQASIQEGDNEPEVETAMPAVPTRASVAKQATVKNVLNLKQVNLIGVSGSPRDRRALVRMSNGKVKRLKVGDRFDGGQVVAIKETELLYQKKGKTYSLSMPKA
ncbi:MAG: hypothetical protein R3D84_13035 [Paracoccaceae bacterium]